MFSQSNSFGFNSDIMINNFPRLENIEGRSISLIELRNCFPWGCSELSQNPVFDKNSELIKVFSSNFSNILKAIKYGIWSENEIRFLNELQELKKHRAQGKKLYYAFLKRYQDYVMLHGIAQAIEFEPGGMFKYWTRVNNYPFFGLIKIKFISVGRLLIDQRELQGSIDNILYRLNETSLDWKLVEECDREEDQLRSQYNQKQQIFYKEKLNNLSRKSQDPLQFMAKNNITEPRSNLQRKKY